MNAATSAATSGKGAHRDSADHLYRRRHSAPVRTPGLMNARMPSADRRRPRHVYEEGIEPDPRFTLANERTLLAWIRTALAFVVTGIGIVALAEQIGSQPLVAAASVVASLTGTAISIGAYLRWQRVERSMRLCRPLPAPSPALIIVGSVVALGFLALGALIARVL